MIALTRKPKAQLKSAPWLQFDNGEEYEGV
jgi:hypothetical protein